ncbi:hypothetical protein GW17_00019243 [Ensete ventricosum]|nr:hypothetical protein GW17_00019243 [Ensete ventricosum]
MGSSHLRPPTAMAIRARLGFVILLLLFFSATLSAALYEDQVGLADWYFGEMFLGKMTILIKLTLLLGNLLSVVDANCVRQVTDTRTARYWAVLSKIDRRRRFRHWRLIEEEINRRRSIEREIDRRWSIEEEKGKKKRKRKKKEEGKKEYLARAPSSPACRRRSWVAHGRSRFFSRARRRSVSPRGEKDRGDVTGTRIVRYQAVPPKIDHRRSIPILLQSYITHSLQVEGLRSMVTIPAKLESTTLVFSYGVDLFFTRIAPSRTYDSLTEDFSYALLLITIVVLVAAIFVTWALSEKKELKEKWR